MASVFTDVSTYLVYNYGGPSGIGNAVSCITLNIPDALAFLNFYPEGMPLPENHKATTLHGLPMYYVSYRADQLRNVLDVLRNEKPIRFYFNDVNRYSYITTAQEPVGEGETP